jgi:hypothetical protein
MRNKSNLTSISLLSLYHYYIPRKNETLFSVNKKIRSHIQETKHGTRTFIPFRSWLSFSWQESLLTFPSKLSQNDVIENWRGHTFHGIASLSLRFIHSFIHSTKTTFHPKVLNLAQHMTHTHCIHDMKSSFHHHHHFI